MPLSHQLAKLRAAIEQKDAASVKVGPHRVKLYSDRSRGRFILCWYNGLKRERWESTDETATKEMAARILSYYEQGEAAAQRVSPDRIQALVEADSALAGVNLEELVRHYKEHLEVKSTPLSEIADLFEKSLVHKNSSVRHRATVKLHLTRLKHQFKCPLRSIKSTQLDTYLGRIENFKTRKNHRITIVSLFRFAQRKGYLPHGPTEADKTECPRTEIREPATWAPSQFRELLRLCDDKRVLGFLVFGAFAGCRSAEIQRLKWSDVRTDCIILGNHVTKTHRRRIAEVPDNLKEWLLLLRGKPECHITFPEKEDYSLHRRARKLAQKAGLRWENNALRHTFVSCHLELHRDPPRTSKTSGHSLAVLEQSYLKLTPREIAEEWFSIRPTAEACPLLFQDTEDGKQTRLLPSEQTRKEICQTN